MGTQLLSLAFEGRWWARSKTAKVRVRLEGQSEEQTVRLVEQEDVITD